MTKVAVVVGASYGLGKEITIQLVKQNYIVYAIARNETKLKVISESIGCFYSAVDILDTEKIKIIFNDIFNKYNQLDLVFLNAAVKFKGFDFSKIHETINVNLVSQIRVVDIVIPFIEKSEGKIIFISSLGDQHPMINANGYNASKAALSNFARALRLDLMMRKSKIKIILVRPGLLDTKMLKYNSNLFLKKVKPSKAADIILKNINRNKENIIFPFYFRILSWLLGNIPDSIFSTIFKIKKLK